MVKVTIELTKKEQQHIAKHDFWDACEPVNKIMEKVQKASNKLLKAK
jgi:hypothetical protein